MWGKVQAIDKLGDRIRITPTHVGKRMNTSNGGVKSWDHPHPCGEKCFLWQIGVNCYTITTVDKHPKN